MMNGLTGELLLLAGGRAHARCSVDNRFAASPLAPWPPLRRQAERGRGGGGPAQGRWLGSGALRPVGTAFPPLPPPPPSLERGSMCLREWLIRRRRSRCPAPSCVWEGATTFGTGATRSPTRSRRFPRWRWRWLAALRLCAACLVREGWGGEEGVVETARAVAVAEAAVAGGACASGRESWRGDWTARRG